MKWTPIAQFPLIWWNTGLSPAGSVTRTTEDVKFVVEQIRHMRQTFSFSVLGLGEVSKENLGEIMAGLNDQHLSVIDVTEAGGRLTFDTAIIYDRRHLTKVTVANRETPELMTPRELIERYGKHKLKLGQLVTFTTTSQPSTVIHVIVSHWPSRLYASEMDSKRMELGALLRISIDRWRNGDADSNDYIVLMGDYNDDPFSTSLAKHLLATRDRQLARSHRNYFYNPFWRCIGESLPMSKMGEYESICGTHFYPSGNDTEWFTYDQIIFSSAFLADGPVILSEEYSKIINTPDLIAGLRDRRHFCDHFPVLSVATMRRHHE